MSRVSDGIFSKRGSWEEERGRYVLTLVENPSVDQDESEDDPGNSHQSDVVSDLEVDDGSASVSSKFESDLLVDGQSSLDETRREDRSKHVDSTVPSLSGSWRRRRNDEKGRGGTSDERRDNAINRQRAMQSEGLIAVTRPKFLSRN